MPKPIKQFNEYIIKSNLHLLDDYAKHPAVAFLKYTVDAKNAMNLCTRYFPKKKRGVFASSSNGSMQIISANLLAGIMGNFETFQKYLYADMFDNTIYLKKFPIKQFCKKLKNELSVEIDIERFSAYRHKNVSVGLIIADSLKNWHSPEKVNSYFSAFGLKDINGRPLILFSNNSMDALRILWQMRHSIVHTAATITIPDSQKVPELNSLGDQSILLDLPFINEVSRKMHQIIKESVENMENIYIPNLKDGIDVKVKNDILEVFKVSSSCAVWLK